MLLFFKEIYRQPILGREAGHNSTPKRLPRVGCVVQACVGPSRIFARCGFFPQSRSALTPERAAQVEACYGALDPAMIRLTFERIE